MHARSRWLLWQGLGSEGIQLYVGQLRSAFLGATEAEAVDNGEGSSGGGAAAVDRARAWAVEQLCGAAQLPAASAETKAQALRFLATHAFFAGAPLTKPKAAKVWETAPTPLRGHCSCRSHVTMRSVASQYVQKGMNHILFSAESGAHDSGAA